MNEADASAGRRGLVLYGITTDKSNVPDATPLSRGRHVTLRFLDFNDLRAFLG